MKNSSVSWSAKWISSTVLGGINLTAPVPYFRTAFKLEGGVKSAVLHVTALGLYECEINGKVVGDHVFAPGWTDYRKRVYFQSYDVASLLTKGENGIGVILGDGWYCGNVAWGGRQIYGNRPLLLLQLEVTTENGSTTRIVSDSTWKTTVGPILESDFLMGETYDARRELGNWSSAGYDDSSWHSAIVAGDPKIAIERSPGPPVRRHEILGVKNEEPDKSAAPSTVALKALHDCRIYDFGQNLTGRVRVSVRGKAGTRVVMRHAEILNSDGTLYTENLRSARATDTYTLKGDGIEVWEPRFTFHGFRYVEIRRAGSSEGFAVEKVEAIVLHSDTPRTGFFKCSHSLLNQLEHNILWGQKGNFLEVPTDCPQRDERLGWTGDAQVFIRTAAFHMDVQGFFHKWMKDMRDSQDANGAVPAVVPNMPQFGLFADGGPAWADAAMICPWTIYLCYGDPEILRDNFDMMVGYMNYLEKNKVTDLIRGNPAVLGTEFGAAGCGDWLALDGSGKLEGGTAKDLIGTAFYAHIADIVAKCAEVLGRKDEMRKYRELHGKIVQAFARRYVTPYGLLAGSTQTAYVLALHFNLVPANVRATAAEQLVQSIKANGMHLSTGFVSTSYLLHVLEATGHLDIAYKLLEQETFPSWLFPVKNGATTIWERWDGWTPEKGFQDKSMNSFNHYAYGAVGDWMVSTVAGLDIGEPGYKKILFKPRPGGTITSAEAKLKTPQGEAAIRWEINGDALDLQLTVPEGSEATLSLPEGWTSSAKSFTPGTHKVAAKK